ncbi:hypothetical protein BJY01DRAFT_100189 [Aspergillus pseudoustus]|uniref:Actin-like ATPase domain-containing protein n=1 Tax=Aspergillus pseudoustus TaxID=1810923 RepID=A0ABR4IY71_9EURO
MVNPRKRRRASTIIIADSDGEERDGDVVMLEVRSRSTTRTAATTGTSTPAPDPRTSFSSSPTSPTVDSTVESPPRTKFIIGLDYGTTFSSVSYIKFDPANPPSTLRGEQIKSVTAWPGAGDRARNIPEVPSESWYLDNEYYWGYGARQAIIGIEDDNLNYKNRIIQYAKLLLPGTRAETKGPREELRRTLLRARKDETEVSKDYLRQVLNYTKQFLQQREGFSEDCEVELVFCVPAGWPAKAIRTMQEILLDITREIKLGILAPLFVLNEPEAAAAYLLEAHKESEKLTTGEVFMVCDAGGGTVDTITYKVREELPFRVDEVVAPTGGNCGSSYANQALKRLVTERIKSTRYSSLNSLGGPSFEYLIEYDVMTKFEYEHKRGFDPAQGLDGNEVLIVHGLKKNEALGFGNSTMRIPRRDIAGLFKPSLDAISKLIRQQLNEAAAKGLTVEKVLLVGGFSSAPILRTHIQTEFPSLKIMYPPFDLYVTVSHGAVFRALNKSHGPKRIVQSNFGFLQIEQYNRRLLAHQKAGPRYNETDGRDYVHRVLDWVIKKDLVLNKRQHFRTRNWQTFKLHEELVINQKVWVSDFDNARDHYRVHDPPNRGAEVLGILRVDLEQVKNEGLLEVRSGPEGQFYEIHYELWMEVDGRNLAVKLLCPPGGICRAQTQLCIAAAFTPGTE